MKYILNLIIVFDPDNRSLILRNDDKLTIGLSKPATRLLVELIKNNKNEMTREALLKNVWEDYGFSPSSATLSNHISELRKAFEALGGCKDIVITVPRVGFKMEAEIHPETKPQKEDSSVENEIKATESEPAVLDNVTPNLIDSSPKKTHRRMLKPSILLTLMAIIASAKLITMNRDEEPMLVGIKDKCYIYTPGYNIKNNEKSVQARKMIFDEKIDCTQENYDIYYIETRQTNDLLKSKFMAACTQSADMNYKNCNNYKLVE